MLPCVAPNEERRIRDGGCEGNSRAEVADGRPLRSQAA